MAGEKRPESAWVCSAPGLMMELQVNCHGEGGITLVVWPPLYKGLRGTITLLYSW